MSSRKYAAILGNLGNTRDRYCHGYKTNPSTIEMLERASKLPHISGIELVGTWDVRPDNVDEIRAALKDLKLECVSIIPDLFANPIYGKGSYSSKDADVRRQAVEYTRETCHIARALGCKIINIWPGQDGYDYLLTADYEKERNYERDCVRELASEFPDLSFALEYKPKEPRTHSYLARMADTLLLAVETECPNVGITIDTGHAFYAGEVVGESIALAKRTGNRLMHMHFNDNFSYWDDDMMVGSVRTTEYIEILYWLDRSGYDGWLSMDQYPYREDAADAIGESISWLVAFDRIYSENRDRIDELVALGDPVQTSRFFRNVLVNSR